MQAIYISSNQFKVSTDKTSEFLTGRRVRALCGSEYKYSTVYSSTYSSPDTTITLEEGELTSNLSEVHYGIINIGEQGSFPKHSHDGDEGTGGALSLLTLSDTPTTYSGVSGQYLKTTSSGIEFVEDLYTKSEVDTISGTLQTNIDGKSDTSHFHDDRYYTESEVDTISGTLQTNIDDKAVWHLIGGSPGVLFGKETDIAIDQEVGVIYEKFSDAESTTWNPLDKGANISLSNNDLTAKKTVAAGIDAVRSIGGKSSGKWYWEVTSDSGYPRIGIGTDGASLTDEVGNDVYGYGFWATNGGKYHNGIYEAFGSYFYPESVIGVALDMDTGKLWWSLDGVWQASGNPEAGTNEAYSGINGTFFAMGSSYQLDGQITVNFGGSAFSYSAPSGFIAGLTETEESGWTKQLSPDFLKLSDTPITYSDSADKYLKTTTSGIEFSDDDLYTKSEVDTISGSLSSEIDTDVSIHAADADAHHNESHTIASHSDTSGTGAELDILTDGSETSLHKHDDRYYTESEVDTISGTLQTSIDDMPVTLLELEDTPTTYSGAEGKYLKTTSSGVEFSQISLLDLADTPTAYSGSVDKYLKTTSSGIIFSDIDSEYWESVDVFLDENYSNDKGLPTQVERGLFKGYSMPIWSTPANQYEELVFRIRAPFRWDGVTNPTFMILVSISATEDIGDNFKFQMEWESKGVSNVIPDTTAEVLTDELAVTNGTAYYSYLASASLDATKLIVGDNLQFRVRRVTATDPQVSNEIIIWHWDSRWKMNKLGTVGE